jgi:hypothetical protein
MAPPKKRIRSDTEVAALATQVAADWTAGDAVLTWLRRHVEALTRMVHDDGWSWPDLARALTVASICYRSGHPWTGDLLRKKAAEARTPRRSVPNPAGLTVDGSAEAPPSATGRVGALDHAVPSPATQPSPAPHSPPLTGAVGEDVFDDDDARLEPAFGFARLRGWSPPSPRPPGQEPAPVSSSLGAPSTGEPTDRAEALEQFLRRPRRGVISMPPVPEPEDE